jgi:serine/threonine-protein kinase PknG
VPLVDGSDPAAGYLATLGGLEPAAQADALLGAATGDAGVPAAVSGSVETRLALARALIGTRDSDARAVLASLAADEPGDWRIAWYNGLLDLAGGNAASARGAFGAVFDELPGELAPKLALAFAAEADGDPATARRYFQLVWTVDRSYISAAFGLARACAAMGQRPAAVAALAAVPETSSQHAAAQIAAVRLLVAGGDGISADDLRQADGRLGSLVLDDMRRQQLTVEVLKAALDWVSGAAPGSASGSGSGGAPPGGAPPGGAPSGGAAPAGGSPEGAPARGASPAGGVAVATVTGKGTVAIPGDLRIVGCEPSERALRFGLERGYRMLASLTRDPARKVELVDMANEIRPRTWT